MKRFSILILILASALPGCTQVPPATTHSVSLTWTAPAASSAWAGCSTTAPCVYSVYRCTGTATACGTLSSTAWTEITTTTTRPSGTAYTDTNVTGGGVFTYAVETVQGPDNSGPSNTTTATVPGTPVAPAIGTPTVAKLETQPLPAATGELAKVAPVTGLKQAGE